MTIFVFRSTDTGAPALSGEVDKLRLLLKAVLVDGYNSHTSGLSITRSGSTATVTKTSHGYVTGQVVRNAGWTQAQYNIDAVITRIDANSYSYTVSGTPATPGTGTGTAKQCPLDWTEAFSGTNIGSFRNRTGSNQFYLGVDDSNAQNTRLRGFETMTAAGVAVADGTGPFPTDAQLSGGNYLYKSSTANSTARAWKLWSNGKFFILFVQYDGTSWLMTMFGDFTSYKAGDAYNTLIAAAHTASNASPTTHSGIGTFQTITPQAGHFIARGHAQTGGSVITTKVTAAIASSNSDSVIGANSTFFTYPAPIIGGIIMARVLLSGTTPLEGPRGRLPGVWAPAHNRPLTSGDTFSGAAGSPIAGRTFEVANVATNGQFEIETSQTWD